MADKQIKFQSPLIRNIEEFLVDSGTPFALNLYLDESVGVNIRPGLTAWKTLPGAIARTIRSILWWAEREILIVIADDQVFALRSSAGVFANVTGNSLEGLDKPVMAATSNWLYMAAGGKMLLWDGTNPTQTETDVNAPTSVSSLAFTNDSILAAQKNTQNWFYAEPGAAPALPLVWEPEALSTEGNEDSLARILTGWGEIYMCGPKSIEVWEYTGSSPTPFSRTQFIERGVMAPHSMVKVGSNLIFLDNYRRFVIINGRTPEAISGPIDRELARLSRADDCIAGFAMHEGRPFYVASFPTATRTFAFDLGTKDWSEWTWWNLATRTHEHFLGLSPLFIEEWGITVVPSRLRQASTPIFTLGGRTDNGELIQAIGRTANLDHGFPGKKESNRLSIFVSRGRQADPAADAGKMLIRWRSDDKPWSRHREIDLGKMGDTRSPKRLFRLGQYERRQYEIQITDPIPFVLHSLVEDVEPLLS